MLWKALAYLCPRVKYHLSTNFEVCSEDYLIGFPNKVNPKRHTPIHIVIKMAKIKDKEIILKVARMKKTSCIQGKPHKAVSLFLRSNIIREKRVAGDI